MRKGLPRSAVCMMPTSRPDAETAGYVRDALEALRLIDPDRPFRAAKVWNGVHFDRATSEPLSITMHAQPALPYLGSGPMLCINVIEVRGFSRYRIPCIRFGLSEPIPVRDETEDRPDGTVPQAHLIARAYGLTHAFPDDDTMNLMGIHEDEVPNTRTLLERPIARALIMLLAHHINASVNDDERYQQWELNPFSPSGPEAIITRAMNSHSASWAKDVSTVQSAFPKIMPTDIREILGRIGVSSSPIDRAQALPLPQTDVVEAMSAAALVGRITSAMHPEWKP